MVPSVAGFELKGRGKGCVFESMLYIDGDIWWKGAALDIWWVFLRFRRVPDDFLAAGAGARFQGAGGL